MNLYQIMTNILSTIKRLYAIFVIGLCGLTVFAADSPADMTIVPVDQICIVPFRIECSNSKEIFANKLWGVSIVGVEVDGIKVVSEKIQKGFITNPAGTIQVDASMFVYLSLCEKNSIDNAVTGNSTAEVQYVRYSWPEKYNELKITYRERFPDLTLGKTKIIKLVPIQLILKQGKV